MKLQGLQLLTAMAVSAGVTLSAGLVLLSLSSHSASSQAARTIKIVVPNPPGGLSDTVARLLGDQIGRSHAQTILIENRAGAGGMIAAEAVSRAAPDGNMLLVMYPDALIRPHLRKLNFDLLDGFEHICELVSAPVIIVVNGASTHRTLADLIVRPGVGANDAAARVRGPKDGTGTSSDHGSTESTARWWQIQQLTMSERTPFSRMLPSVIGGPVGCRCLAMSSQGIG